LNVPLSHMYPAIANVPYTIVDAHATRYQPRTVRVRRQRPKTEVRARASDFLLRSRFCTSHIISAASRSVSEWAVHECQWAVRGSIIVRPALLSAASGTAPGVPCPVHHTPSKGRSGSGARAVAHLNCGWLVGHTARPWPSRIGRRACVLMRHEQFSSCCFHMVSCPDVSGLGPRTDRTN